MERHSANALEIAGWLERHPCVRRVLYSGLPSHPQHALATRQMRGFSGIVTAELDLGLEETKRGWSAAACPRSPRACEGWRA